VQLAPPLAPEDRIEIYSDAWFLRLEESLVEDFDTVAKAIGEDAFSEAVREFLEANPPTSYAMVGMGDAFPEWLRSTGRFPDKPWLYDVACFERAQYRAFYAEEAKPESFAELASKSGETDLSKISLKLENAVSLLSSRWDIQACAEAEEPEFPPSEETTLILFYRKGLEIAKEQMNERKKEFQALKLLQKPLTLGEFLEIAPSDESPAWLGDWAAKGIIKLG
jgi:hypothetical protein